MIWMKKYNFIFCIKIDLYVKMSLILATNQIQFKRHPFLHDFQSKDYYHKFQSYPDICPYV